MLPATQSFVTKSLATVEVTVQDLNHGTRLNLKIKVSVNCQDYSATVASLGIVRNLYQFTSLPTGTLIWIGLRLILRHKYYKNALPLDCTDAYRQKNRTIIHPTCLLNQPTA